ncbi:Asp-tRNA(Asn)/Glu-tRNA(Gln) amidotransferase subunit GatC [Patescibacteria group bacterium]|nr:Asp-tRNA(Asn)/Glu-tRNA(Gln) amidotransferase subunit GatC [Patescibacteria group bacterium]
MAITKEEVKHLAKLARIGLSKEEVDRFQKQITSILDYVDMLKRVTVEKGEKIVMSDVENILRDDVVKQSKNQEKLIEQAPDKKDGHVKVKTILKKNETI